MNPIELEWQHLKKDELTAKSFEDELDLDGICDLWSSNKRRKGKLQYTI